MIIKNLKSKISGFAYRVKSNRKGYVTVLVTLILVPSLLVTGTMTDAVRINASRSILQSANQLAANSLLASYDALLQDVYGLFAIETEHPELIAMVNEYIRLSVFGSNRNENPPEGSFPFQPFYGTISSSEIQPLQRLSDVDVLRRQIEEYMKFRGPVLIVQSVMNSLGSSENASETAQVAQHARVLSHKLDAIEGLDELMQAYAELYEGIQNTNELVRRVGGIADAGGQSSRFGVISNMFRYISYRFLHASHALIGCDGSCNATPLANCTTVNGWVFYYDALQGLPTDDPARSAFETGLTAARNRFTTHLSAIPNYIVTFDSAVANVRDYMENIREELNEIISISERIDQLRTTRIGDIQAFISELEDLDADDPLRQALEATEGDDGEGNAWSVPISQIGIMRGILEYQVIPMATSYRVQAFQYLDRVETVLNQLSYRRASNLDIYHGQLNTIDPNVPLNTLRSLNALRSHFGYTNTNTPPTPAQRNLIVVLAGFRNLNLPGNGTGHAMPLNFQVFREVQGANQVFYDEFLYKLANMGDNLPDHNELFEMGIEPDGDEDDQEGRSRGLLRSLGRLLDHARNGLLPVPGGAMYVGGTIPDPIITDGSDENDRFRDETRGALNAAGGSGNRNSPNFWDIIRDPGGVLGGMGDYALLLTYSLNFFSNYATNRGLNSPSENNGSVQRTPTGVPFSIRMNYFYQSEWEYLLFGNSSASANLGYITAFLIAIRLAANYITVWKVPKVTAFVKKFWAIPFVGFALGEVARFMFVMGETLIDVANLRNGWKVPIIKRPTEWIAQPGPRFGQLIADLARVTPPANLPLRGCRAPRGCRRCLTYENYLLAFFLMRALGALFGGGLDNLSRTKEQRIGELIELNIINFRQNLYRLPNNTPPGNFLESLQQNLEKIISPSVKRDDIGNFVGSFTSNDRGAREREMRRIREEGASFQFSQMTTDFRIETTAEVQMLFISMPLAQRGLHGVIPPSRWELTVADYRGY